MCVAQTKTTNHSMFEQESMPYFFIIQKKHKSFEPHRARATELMP